MRVRVAFSRAVYAYLFWIDASGHVQALHEPQPQSERRVRAISVPNAADSVFPVVGTPGTEVCVAVVRESPVDRAVGLAAMLQPPAAFPPLASNTVLMEGRVVAVAAEGKRVESRNTEFPPPAAWHAGERPRGLGPPERLDGAAALEYFQLWHSGLPADAGQVHYVALPHEE